MDLNEVLIIIIVLVSILSSTRAIFDKNMRLSAKINMVLLLIVLTILGYSITKNIQTAALIAVVANNLYILYTQLMS